MRPIAQRNMAMKKTLAGAFPKCKISVRGSRGTAYGYADVDVDYTPLDQETARTLRGLCFKLLERAGIDVGRRYTDDTCQYECPEVSVNFNTPRYAATMKHEDGTMSVRFHHGAVWKIAKP